MYFSEISVFTTIHAATLGRKYHVFLVTNMDIGGRMLLNCGWLHLLKSRSLANTNPRKLQTHKNLTA